jgi:exonuclease III
MPAFPKPKFAYTVNLALETQRLRQHAKHRQIPKKSADKLLIASWNIANLGAQQRDNEHIALIAQIISWFDLIAIQECKDNYTDLERIRAELPSTYKTLMSDASGNQERMVYLYDSKKTKLLEEIGEIAFPPNLQAKIKLEGIEDVFMGFDRTPFLASFSFAGTSLTLVNVHSFYGSEAAPDINRRALETFAVAKWSEKRAKSSYAYTRHLLAMGDFNMPKREKSDPIYKALTKLGLELPEHSAEIGSSIASDSHYDQIALLPASRGLFGVVGVFDFDGVMFPDLWAEGTRKKDFMAYCRYYLSDHRPIWIEFVPDSV